MAVACRALFQELESKAQGAGQAETTVRELALLNQLFSVQVVQQAEQIELLYHQVRPNQDNMTTKTTRQDKIWHLFSQPGLMS